MDPASRRAWWIFAGVMLAALVVRGGALWTLRGQLQADPDAYRQIAEGLMKTGVYTIYVTEDANRVQQTSLPTAYRPPLYPLLLTNVAVGGEIEPLGVASLHLALGLATVALVFHLGRQQINLPGGAVAAILVACDPILLNQSALVMTETLATLLAVLCLWLLSRFDGTRRLSLLAVAGAALAVASLCRPTFLPWLALVALVVLCRRGSFMVRAARCGTLVVAALIVLAPWIIRNYRVFGQPIVATTHGGYTLWLANNDDFYDYLRSEPSTAWEVERLPSLQALVRFTSPSVSGEPFELAYDKYFRKEARETIRARPGMFLYSSLVRIGYLWSPLPQKTTLSESTYRLLARYLVAIWYSGVYLLAVLGVYKLRGTLLHSPWVWGLTLCLALTAVHAVYWSNLRMRAPLMPVVALLAAAGSTLTRSVSEELRPTAGD